MRYMVKLRKLLINTYKVFSYYLASANSNYAWKANMVYELLDVPIKPDNLTYCI